MTDSTTLWIIIAGLAVGSFILRFSFLGIIGDRPLPEWVLRHLRYTAVAVIPALIAPLVAWPSATNGEPDLPRMAAAVATLVVGLWTRQPIFAIIAGGATLMAGISVLG